MVIFPLHVISWCSWRRWQSKGFIQLTALVNIPAILCTAGLSLQIEGVQCKGENNIWQHIPDQRTDPFSNLNHE